MTKKQSLVLPDWQNIEAIRGCLGELQLVKICVKSKFGLNCLFLFPGAAEVEFSMKIQISHLILSNEPTFVYCISHLKIRHLKVYFPAGIYLLKVNNRNMYWRLSDVFIVNFEHISHLVSIVNCENVVASWVSP